MRLLVVFLLAFPVAAQFDTIRLNGVDLKPGMEKGEVLEKLLKTNHLARGGEMGEWCVVSNEEYDKGGYHTILCFDNIWIADGKLVAVYHHLEDAQGSEASAALVNSLWRILADAHRKGIQVTVLAQPEPEKGVPPDQRVRIIDFYIGQKQFKLSVAQSVGITPAYSSVSLSESMGF